MGKAECSVTGSMTMGVGMVVTVIMAGGVRAADPDPVQDYAVDTKSFVVRDIFKQGEILHDTGGVRAALTTANFPAITTQGITYVRVRIVACGCTLAHSHPRATEIMTLISGGPLQVGFIDTKEAGTEDYIEVGTDVYTKAGIDPYTKPGTYAYTEVGIDVLTESGTDDYTDAGIDVYTEVGTDVYTKAYTNL
ncbi:hypothetical protein L7F22_009955 [Adiantum nelumboides]|nr:hypothetical protein [Adiantum nelumboides]